MEYLDIKNKYTTGWYKVIKSICYECKHLNKCKRQSINKLGCVKYEGT